MSRSSQWGMWRATQAHHRLTVHKEGGARTLRIWKSTGKMVSGHWSQGRRGPRGGGVIRLTIHEGGDGKEDDAPGHAGLCDTGLGRRSPLADGGLRS